jgi:outer membrane protein OmpA-like peptidoglycan-associated protein
MSAQRILASGAAALLVLIVLAIATHDEGGSGNGNPTTTTTLPNVPPGTLRVHVAGGSVTLDGPVKDTDERKEIEQAADERFGHDNVSSNLQVVATADSASWLADAMAALPRKGGGFGPIDVEVTKTAITVSGRVPTAGAGQNLLAAIRSASNRKVTDKLEIVAGGAAGLLQKRINDALDNRTIGFGTGSAGITKAGQKVLLDLVAPLKAGGSQRVVVGGYTDDVGDAKANLNLSKARANSVRVFLVKHGVPAARLIARGFGETHPIASNKTEAGRQKNRRIEFTVLGG